MLVIYGAQHFYGPVKLGSGLTAVQDTNGITELSAAVTSVDWANITNKPATFPPSAHTHPASQITAGTFPGASYTFAADVIVSAGLYAGGVYMQGSQPTLAWDPAGAGTEWIMYQVSTADNNLYIRDMTNARMHMTFTQGASHGTAVTIMESMFYLHGDMWMDSIRSMRFKDGVTGTERATMRILNTDDLVFEVAGSERLRISEIGETSLNGGSLRAWNTSYAPLQLGSLGAFMSGRVGVTSGLYIMESLYYATAGWTYPVTGNPGVVIQMVSGDILFDHAQSGTVGTVATLTRSLKLSRLTSEFYSTYVVTKTRMLSTDGTEANYRWQTYLDGTDGYNIYSRSTGTNILTLAYTTGVAAFSNSLNINSGALYVHAGGIALATGNAIYFDYWSGAHTYIHELSNDSLYFIVGGATALVLTGGSTALFAGEVQSTSGIRAGTGTNGYVRMANGGASNNGYYEWYSPAGVRQAYFGFGAAGGPLSLILEAATYFSISKYLSAPAYYTTSTIKAKENLVEIDYSNALDILRNTRIFTYNLKDRKELGLRVGYVAEMAHEFLVNEDRDSADLHNAIALLIASIHAVDERLSRIEA